MLMHEKLMTGQFFELKTDIKPLLHHHHYHHAHHQTQLQHSQLQQTQHHHHHHHQAQQSLHAQQPAKMDLYTAYAYQQQLLGSAAAAAALNQQQAAVSVSPASAQPAQSAQTGAANGEVLDLSCRCDSVETPRKTPSPYQTSYSYGSGSPAASPTTAIPSNLLYSAQAAAAVQQQQQQLATLYPALYYGNIKQEPTSGSNCAPKAVTASLLQTFAAASAAAVAAANSSPRPASNASTMQIDVLGAPQSPPAQSNDSPDSNSNNMANNNNHGNSIQATTPTSSTAGSAAHRENGEAAAKNTRPFKAFPRDPLVIAANFAATDVLLDNPRVERYTEYRKRVLEQIRSSYGGARTVTNPKMRRTNSRSGSVNEGSSSNNNSESEDRAAAEESSDCDSHASNFDKLASIATSAGATTNTMGSGNGSTGASNASNSSQCQIKDAAYYERRRKNNAAAKKSRDRRRIKEDEIAIRAAYLERQNIELLCQIDALKAQLATFTAKVAV